MKESSNRLETHHQHSLLMKAKRRRLIQHDPTRQFSTSNRFLLGTTRRIKMDPVKSGALK